MNWGQITIVHIKTSDQMADELTKALAYADHERCSDQMTGVAALPGAHFSNGDLILFLRNK